MEQWIITEFLTLAAKKSTVHSKFVAIIMYRNKVISTGFNYVKDISSKNSFEKYEPNKHSVHAERDAIMKVKNKAILNKCRIIIYKLTHSGVPKECGPCEMCFKLLNKYCLKQKRCNRMCQECCE
jgi:cytidine deaminase